MIIRDDTMSMSATNPDEHISATGQTGSTDNVRYLNVKTVMIAKLIKLISNEIYEKIVWGKILFFPQQQLKCRGRTWVRNRGKK